MRLTPRMNFFTAALWCSAIQACARGIEVKAGEQKQTARKR